MLYSISYSDLFMVLFSLIMIPSGTSKVVRMVWGSKTERFKRIMTILISIVLLVALFWVKYHQLRPSAPIPPTPSPVTTIYADTTRVRLQHQADSSARSLLIVSQSSQQTIKPYDHARQTYDSIRVDLP